MSEGDCLLKTFSLLTSPLSSAVSYSSTASSRRQVSRHGVELHRIRTDAARSQAHPVPHYYNISKFEELNDDGEEFDDESQWSVETVELVQKARRLIIDYCSSKSASDWVEIVLPAWRWLKDYDWISKLPSDLVAGLTVGVMVVPQSMSYAALAGLPVEYGLYSALTPMFTYSLFGSSRQLSVGPVAISSLLLSTGLSIIMTSRGIDKNDPSYQQVYARLAIQTSCLVGVTYVVMGIARLGFVTIFLSHAVISGFTTGAAVIIAVSQAKYIFGYEIEQSDLLQANVKYLWNNIYAFNYKVFLMGVFTILLLALMKKIGKKNRHLKYVRVLGPLTATAIGIGLAASWDLGQRGIPLVGAIPRGFPSVTLHQWTPIEDFKQLYMIVLSIAVVGFMESIAIAKQLAAKHRYDIDASDELIGLGMANFVGAMFQAYPVTGSFSRSAVNHESGAQSGIAGFVTATLVAFVLLFLTPVFEKLPLCILAAIVISGVLTIMDFTEAKFLYDVHKFDFSVWVVAFLGTMFLGVEIGLGIAVVLSILIVIYEATNPHTAALGRLPGTSVYRNVEQYPNAECTDGVIIIRIDASLFFANAQNVRDQIRKYRLAAEEKLAFQNAGELKYIILELSPVSYIDSSALHILEDMRRNTKSRGQQLCFANPSMRVMQRMVASGFAQKIGRQHFFSCSHDAVKWCLATMDVEARSLLNIEPHHGREGSDAATTLVSDDSAVYDILGAEPYQSGSSRPAIDFVFY